MGVSVRCSSSRHVAVTSLSCGRAQKGHQHPQARDRITRRKTSLSCSPLKKESPHSGMAGFFIWEKPSPAHPSPPPSCSHGHNSSSAPAQSESDSGDSRDGGGFSTAAGWETLAGLTPRRGDPGERDDTPNSLQEGSWLPFEATQAAGGLLHTDGNAGTGYSRKIKKKRRFCQNWWPQTPQPCRGQAALTPSTIP